MRDRDVIGTVLGCVLFLAAAGVCAASALASATSLPEPTSATVPFALDHNRLVVEVEFIRRDGSVRPALAWMDTGNPYLVLSETLARDLGIDVDGLTKAGGQHSEEIPVTAPSARLGGLALEVEGVKTRVHPGPVVRPGLRAEANLPPLALRHFRVVLDYPLRRLTVTRSTSPPPQGQAIPCQVSSETGLLQVEATLDGATVPLGIDNGSAGTWLSEAVTRSWQTRHPDWPAATGAAGSANFFGFPFESQGTLMRLPELGLGTLRARDVAVLGLDQGLFDWYSKKTAQPVIGFIGANVLVGFRLEIDFPNQTTYWEAAPTSVPADLDIVGLTIRPEAGGGFTVAGVVRRKGVLVVAGVEVGDTLVSVDGLAVTGAAMGAVVDALRGSPGAVRVLVVERQGVRRAIEARVERLP